MSNAEDFDFSWYDAQIAEISVLFKSNSSFRDQVRIQTRTQALIYYRILTQSLIDFPPIHGTGTARPEYGVYTTKLAEKLGVSLRTLVRWRTATAKFPNEDALIKHMSDTGRYTWSSAAADTECGGTQSVGVPAEIFNDFNLTRPQIRKIAGVYLRYPEIQDDLRQLAKEMIAEGKL